MDYRKYGETFYIRMDRADEIISKILEVCQKENIRSATYSGIGGCGEAMIQTYMPETDTFEMQNLKGMLELVSLTGNIISDEENNLYPHTHGVFSYKKDGKHCVSAGHIKSITVSYTGEIELRPVERGVIARKFDSETGTSFWDFK